VNDLRTAQLNLPPDMIELGAGQPSPGLLPREFLQQAAKHRLAVSDVAYLAYGAEQGDDYFRSALASFLSKHYQMRIESESLFITAGASQGLDLICTLFSKPGDTIFVEEPSYFLALRIFADHGLEVVSLPMDDQGLIPEAVEKHLYRQKPVFLYTIPTYHNPSSVTLAADRRARLAQLGREHNFLIIADEVYQLLNYEITPPSPLASYIDGNPVISLGSFSKIMAPGLRLGWVQASKAILERITGCGLLDSGGGLNPFTSGVMRSAIELGLLQKQLDTLKKVYRQRKIALSNALKEYLPETVTFIEPEGGFFIWLKFEGLLDTAKLLAAARQHKVGFLPGIKFSSRNGLSNCARLSFAYFDTPALETGAMRLAEAIRAYPA
jgi:DNA-binding transcriptional MocR family regulator